MNIKSKLEEIERRAEALGQNALIIEYTMPDGTTRTGTLDDADRDNGCFKRVVEGNSLHDVQRILDGMKRQARESLQKEQRES